MRLSISFVAAIHWSARALLMGKLRSARRWLSCLALAGFACATFLSVASFAQNPPLNFGDNFFVTGDYVVAGAYGMNLTYSGGFTAGIIGIPDLNPGIRGTTTVPKGADIVAAFLYWQTVENSSVMPGQPGSGQNGFFGPVFNPLSNKSPHLYPITGVNLSSQAATPFGNGACSGAPPGKVVRTYRAEVRAFLPQDAQGNVLVDWPDGVTFAVRLPSVDDSTPYTLGATLVIIYRVLSPNFPLNSIVIYDGDFAPSSNTSLTMTQSVQGFYQAANNPVTRMTNIVGAGKINKFQAASLGGGENGIQRPPEALPSPYGPGLPAFPGWYGNWDNTTWTFPDPEFPNLANPLHENDDSATATVVASGGHPGCVSWGVVIVSTRVKSSDGDGLLDVWKNNPKSPGRPGYCDASFNGGVCNVGDSSWVDLPGAIPGHKDVFVQLDYMCSNPTGPDKCDTSTNVADSLSGASPGGGGINASGGYTTYTLTGTTCSPPFAVGAAITIGGFMNAANNGQFTVASCAGTQLVVNNAKGVTETNPGTATFTNYSFDPRQVLDPGTGMGSFDEVAAAYAKKGITLHPEWHAMPETPGCADTVVNGVPSYCPYLYQPGLVGWKDGFDSLKGQPLNYPDESSCETLTPLGGRPGTGPVCMRRFQYGRKDSYHEVIFAHAQGEPEWSLQGGSLTSVVATGTTVTFTTSTPHGLVSASGMYDQNPLSRVTVSDAISDTMLSGTYLVQTTPTPTSFTIQITAATNATFTAVTDPVLSVTSGRVHTRSGFSDVGGGDSLVTLGLWDPQLAQQVTGTTLMHEFGHANGLTHGGFYYDKLTPANNDYRPTLEDNCKPNFQSVMTYPFQLAHLDNGASLVVDYSEEQLDPLNEGNLLAGVTINGHAPFYPSTKWYTPTRPLVGNPAKTFCDGTPVPQGTTMYLVGGPADPIGGSTFIQQLLTPPWVSGTDVNFDGTDIPPDEPSKNGQMRGHSDWTNVVAANGLVISPGIDLRQVGATGADAFGSGGSIGPGGGSKGPGGGSRGPGGGSKGPGGGSLGPGGGSLGPGGGSKGPGGGSKGPGGGVGEADVPTATGVTYAPSHLTATEASSPRKVTLNWGQAFGLIGAYNVYRSADGGNTFTRIATVAGNPPATTYTDTVQGNGPPCNPTGYQYVVTAVQSSSSPNPNQESAPSNVVSIGSDGLDTGCYIVTGPSAPASAVQGSIVPITWTSLDDFNTKNFAVSNPAANTLVVNGPLPMPNCGTTGHTTILLNGALTAQSGAASTFPAPSAGQFTFNWDTDGFCAGQYTVTLNLDSGQSQTTSALQFGVDVNDTDSTPHVGTSAIPAGTVGASYGGPNGYPLPEDGGTAPFKWTFTGTFPQGISPSSTGVLSGTTCAAGSYNFTAMVTDSKSNTGAQPLTLLINQAKTTTSVTSSANPAVYGQSVTFTATVKPQYGCTPTGTVTFYDAYNGAPAVAINATNLSSAIVNGDGSLSVSFATSATQLMAGSHSITAVYSGDSNFFGSTSPILGQTVYPKPLTATLTAANKTYDGTTTEPNAMSCTLAIVLPADNVICTASNGTFNSSQVALATTVTATVTISGGAAGNYTLGVAGTATSSTSAMASAKITPALLTATVTGMQVYGSAMPTFAATYSGFVNGDMSSVLVTGTLTCTTTALPTSFVGTYANAISNCSGQNAGSNYSITTSSYNYLTAAFTVYPATLTVTATGVNKVYDGTTTATVTLSDNRIFMTDTITDSYTSASFKSANVGTGIEVDVSGISISGLSAGNYTLSSATASTTANITAAPLTVTVAGTESGGPPPTTFTVASVSYSGFVNGDTSTSGAVTGTLSCPVSQTPDAAGNYPISCSGLTAPNYNINYSYPFGPSARRTVLATDPAGNVVLFGGYDGVNVLADTWVWNGTAWGQQAPATSPSARNLNEMVLDPSLNQVVLFGGSGAVGYNDTWTWNGSNWTLVSPTGGPPPQRYAFGMDYDGVRKAIEIFGGYTVGGPAINDTWELAGSTSDALTYTQLGPSTPPNPLCCAAMAFDPISNSTLLFGGTRPDLGYSQVNDTWQLQNGQWTLLSLAGVPPARSGAAMVYDPKTNTIVLFGGTSASGDLNDTWNWNGTTWTKASPSTSPPARRFDAQGMAYDPNTKTVVMFGGLAHDYSAQTDTPLGDTWTWDGSNWVQQPSITVAPPLRITTPSPLPNAVEGTSYGPVTLTAFGGNAPYMWTGSVDGLSLSSSGVLSGTPTSAGTFGLSAQVTDSTTPPPNTVMRQLSITVAPRAPTGLAPVTVTASSVTLNWSSASVDVASYNIYRATTSGGYTTTPLVSGVGTTNFTDTSVMSGTTYYYVVRAVAANIESANSNEVTVPVPPASPMPGALSFTTGQPTNTAAGAVISPPVQVQAVDAGGAFLQGVAITMAIGVNPSGGTLSGTLTQTTGANGVAAFSDLKIDKAGSGYTLVATSAATSGTTSMSFSITAPPIPIQVAAGAGHTCALLSDGTVECWGINGNGELGNGGSTDSPTPVAVNSLSGVTAIAAGTDHTCALLSSGTVECWGFDGEGQFGNGNATSYGALAVSDLIGATALSAGGFQTCALLSGGTPNCSGNNSYGQLGNGSTTSSNVPVTVRGPGGSGVLSGATAISTGGTHTCALLSSGTVECWGYDANGQLGNGTNSTDIPTPVAVSNLTSVTAISAGGESLDDQTCALLSGGTVECWGYNAFGQLGNGTSNDSSTPVTVSNLTTATAIAAGRWHSCAVLSGGTADCWGYNGSGQLGNGTKTSSNTPVAVGFLSGVTAIAAGADHTCAVLSGGTVECWGLNDHGQLGNGTTTDSNTPVTVIGLP